MDDDGGDTLASAGWRDTSGAARARLDAGGAHAGLLGGSPLTLLQGIIPGNQYSSISIRGYYPSIRGRIMNLKYSIIDVGCLINLGSSKVFSDTKVFIGQKTDLIILLAAVLYFFTIPLL